MLALGAVLVASFARAGEVIEVPVRDGVTEAVFLAHVGNAPPKAIVISFVGGAGAINLERRAQRGSVRFGHGSNFLVRIRSELAATDIVDAIVDAPSDLLPAGMSDAFRSGKTHADDIGKVIGELRKRFAGAPVYLLGTSRGTISAANLGVRLASMIDAVILTSTVTRADRVGPGLSRFDFASLTVPVLFVHHADDQCLSSPYSGAQAAARDKPLITVRGGDPPQSGPCDALSAHGYIGREKATADAIRAFVLGQDYPREISLAGVTLAKLDIVREIAGLQRGRAYAYQPYLDELEEGGEAAVTAKGEAA